MNKHSSQNDADALFTNGDVKPIAEIEIGPTKHEQFLDRNHKKLIALLLLIGLIVSGFIIYNDIEKDKRNKAGALLVSAFSADGKLDLAKFDQVISEYPGTHSALTAAYMKGQALWEQGREKDGNAQMLDFIQTVDNPEFKAQACVILGCHYMSSGDNEAAVKQFQQAIDCGSALYSPPAYLCLGDIARASGKLDEAQKFYSELVEKFPESAFVIQSMGVPEREDLLDVAAPRKVAPAQAPPAKADEVAAPALNLGGQ